MNAHSRNFVAHILRTAEGFEKFSQNEGRVEYLPLESNISNWLNIAYLKSKVDMLFFTIKHCQNFALTKCHGTGVKVGKGLPMEIFFFAIWSCIFSSFLSLFPSLFFCLFLPISYTGVFGTHLIGVDRAAVWRYNGKPNIFGLKIWRLFFLLWKTFKPFLYMLESPCSCYYYPAYYRIKWYWNWKIGCINLAMRVVQKVLDSNYA